MKNLILPIGIAAVLLAACGKKEEQTTAPATDVAPAPATTPAPAAPAATEQAPAATTEQPKN